MKGGGRGRERKSLLGWISILGQIPIFVAPSLLMNCFFVGEALVLKLSSFDGEALMVKVCRGSFLGEAFLGEAFFLGEALWVKLF
ncbi:hypothetical protein ACFX13_018208 [Malus domestica]